MKYPRAPEGPIQLVRDAKETGRGKSSRDRDPFVRMSTLAPGGEMSVRTYEERMGALIARAETPAGLEPEHLQDLWERLSTPRPLRVARGLRWALAASLLSVSSVVAGAELGGWTWPRVLVQQITGHLPSAGTASGARHRSLASRSGGSRASIGKPAPLAPPIVPPPAAPAERPTGRPSESPAPATALPTAMKPMGTTSTRPRALIARATAGRAAPGPPALVEESERLGRALVRLRQDRNAHAALSELDAYATRFPSGVLLPEARRVRVDALLMEGRLSEARDALGALELGTSARDRELRLIRAELLAAHACAAALPDFQTVLAEEPRGPLAERALWGRAACLTQLGDEAAGRRDLAAYLARFPKGAHSAAARARLRD